jgi:N-acetyltransferase
MLDPAKVIERVTLEGERLRLEPLGRVHATGLALAIRDGNLWEIPVTLVPHPDDLNAFFQQVDERTASQAELAFAIVDVASSTVVGSTRFLNINRAHRRVEIGFTFVAQSW